MITHFECRYNLKYKKPTMCHLVLGIKTDMNPNSLWITVRVGKRLNFGTKLFLVRFYLWSLPCLHCERIHFYESAEDSRKICNWYQYILYYKYYDVKLYI